MKALHPRRFGHLPILPLLASALLTGCEPSAPASQPAPTPQPQPSVATIAQPSTPAVAPSTPAALSPTTPAALSAPASPAAPPPPANSPQPAAAPRKPDSIPLAERLATWAAAKEESFQKATEAEAAGDADGAIGHLQDVLALDPRNSTALESILRLSLARGKTDDALAAIEEALKASPKDPTLLTRKGEVLLAGGKVEEALDAVAEISTDTPPPIGAQILRARAHALRGEKDAAVQTILDAAVNGLVAPDLLEKEPAFASLRGDERFTGLIARQRSAIAHAREARALGLEPLTPETLEPLPEAAPDYSEDDLLTGLKQQLKAGPAIDDWSFDLTAVDQKPLKLADLAGKPVVVLCWGAWSVACHQAIRDAQALHDALGPEGLEVVTLCHEVSGVAGFEKDVEESVAAWVKGHDIRLRTASINRKTAEALRLRAFPTIIFIGRDNKCYMKAQGRYDLETLKAAGKLLLETAPAKG